MPTLRSPIKRHGGKHYLAKRIIAMMPPHVHYVEPFFGSGAVLFRKKPEDISEVVNDMDGELIAFWRVLQSPELFDRFQRVIEVTPFAEPLWQEAVDSTPADPVDRAVAFFIRYRQSRQALGRDFATMVKRTRRGMNDHVSAWLSAVNGLPEAVARLRRVLILNRPAVDVIRQNDGFETLFYLDPPYLHETRSSVGEYGAHEMTADDHKKLLTLLAGIKGKFLLSGYPSAMYDEFAQRYGWNATRKPIDNKASGSATKPKRTECIWCNY